MKRLEGLTSALLDMPHYLVPSPRCISKRFASPLSIKENFQTDVFSRSSILALAEKLESAKGWGLERAFSKWVSTQEWRSCLPPIYEFVVPRVPRQRFSCEMTSWTWTWKSKRGRVVFVTLLIL